MMVERVDDWDGDMRSLLLLFLSASLRLRMLVVVKRGEEGNREKLRRWRGRVGDGLRMGRWWMWMWVWNLILRGGDGMVDRGILRLFLW